MSETCNHCPTDKRVDTLERRYEGLLEAFKKMEDKFDSKLDLIIYQINKVAVLEEKHTNQSHALERAFERIRTLEINVDDNAHFRARVDGMAKMAWFVWSAMGVSVASLFAKLYG